MNRPARLGWAATVVAVGVLLSRILGFVREIAIATLIGRNAEADLYIYAFRVPDFLFYLVAGGFMAITLVPILARRMEHDDARSVNEAFTAVFRFVVAALSTLAIIGFLATSSIVDVVFPEVTGSDADRLVNMTRIALVLQVIFAAGALFSAAQYASKKFLVPTLGPLIYNAGIILGGITGAAVGEPTPEAFLWGGLIGAAIGSLGLQWWGASRVGVRVTSGVSWSDPAVGEYLRIAAPLMVGQSVVALDEQWPGLLGQFVDTGIASGLNFARRLNMLPVGVIAQAAGVAAYPFLARLAERGDETELRATVDRSVRSALAIGALATGLVVSLREPLVALAFEYGSFGQADTRIVASFLLLYALSIPFWVVHQVVTRAFYAKRQMWTPVIIGTATTALTVPLLVIALNELGGEGIALVSSLSVATYALVIALRWYRTDAGRLLLHLGKVSVAAVVAGLASTAVDYLLLDFSLPDALRLAIGGFIGLTIYVGMARAIGIDEVTAFVRKVRLRLGG